MERSAAVEVKQVIAALCRLLSAAGLDSVPAPDSFRRAKFGDSFQEEQFWQLLADVLQTAGVVSCEGGAEPGAGQQMLVCPSSERRKLVAAGLWQTGYYADWMYEEQAGGGGARFSSRELLLALGWLLATGTLEKAVMKRVQQLDKTLLTRMPVKPRLSPELQVDSASLRRLQWLIGCLRHQGRTLLSMLQERTRVLHAVLCASASSSASSFCDHSSAAVEEDCVCVQQLCDLLEAYLKWKQVEEVFWTWMDSVVDLHLKDPDVRRLKHLPSGSPGACPHGSSGLEKLEEMLLRLPTAQEAWRTAGGDAEDGGEGRSPGWCDLPLLSSLPQVCRARLQLEKPAGRPAGGPRGGAEAPRELPVSEAVELLLHAEALLQETRDGRRLAHRMELQEVMGRLNGLVLVPP